MHAFMTAFVSFGCWSLVAHLCCLWLPFQFAGGMAPRLPVVTAKRLLIESKSGAHTVSKGRRVRYLCILCKVHGD
jgi:hypothetical protein